MNFQDIVEKSKEQMTILNEIEDFIVEIKRIEEEASNMLITAFGMGYRKLLGMDALYNKLNDLFNKLRELLIGLDGMNLYDTLRRYKEVYNNECIEQSTNEILVEYKNIVEYRKLIDKAQRSDDIINFYKSVNKIIEHFERLKKYNQQLMEMNKDLSMGVAEPELCIRSNVDEIVDKSFETIIKPIGQIYERLCIIANININEYPLKIVRVESGSLTINFNGDSRLCKLIEKILSKVHKIFVRNYSREGEKANIVSSLDVFKQELEIIKEMQELGIDTTEIKEISQEHMIIILKQSNILLTGNPDVKINNKKLNRSEEIKALLNSPRYLSENSVSNDEDEANNN